MSTVSLVTGGNRGIGREAAAARAPLADLCSALRGTL